MKAETQQILETALALPAADRAQIAASLIHSLDPQVDADADAAWAEEIRRRIESIDRGEAKLVPWDEVMGELRRRGHG